MNRPAYTILAEDPEWCDFVHRRADQDRACLAERDRRFRQETSQRSALAEQGYLYSAYALDKIEMFQACFPGESRRSLTKRLMRASKHGPRETPYFRLESSGFRSLMWYVLRDIPDAHCAMCFQSKVVHSDFFTLLLAPMLEYRHPLVRFKADGRVFSVFHGRIHTLDGRFKCGIGDVAITQQTSAGDFLTSPRQLLRMLQRHASGQPCWPCRWTVLLNDRGVRLCASNDVDGVCWTLT